MLSMPNPIEVLLSLQKVLDSGYQVDLNKLDSGYSMIYDEPNGGKRFSFPKIIAGEVQALSIFGLVEPIEGVTCFNVGYAVHENHRGRNLAVEAVKKGINELKKVFSRTPMRNFYVEAVVNETNIHSIKVAEILFSGPGKAMTDSYTGTPSQYFKMLISI